jgi:rhamnulokinase
MAGARSEQAPRRHVAVDMGAESSRVMLGTLHQNRLELEELHRFATRNTEVLGTRYWDALFLFDEIKTGVRTYVERHGSALDGVGVDTWGVDFGLLGRDGGLLANPVHYRDHRTDGVAELLSDTVPHAEIYRRSGIQFMPFNTLNQLWAVRKNTPELLRHAHTLLFMPDLMHYFLSGARAAEYTIASTSQVLDVRTRTWSESLLEAFGIPMGIFPDVVAPGTRLGTLNAGVAKETGLDTSTPVIAPCGHDTASAVAAVPAEGEDWAFLSSGTWSLMGMELREPITTDEALANHFTNEGGIDGTIRFLKNIMGLWVLQGCRAAWARRGKDYGYDELAARAEEAKPFASVIDVDDPCFFNPGDMLDALAMHCRANGQPVPETVGATVRAVLEGLALRYAMTLERLEHVTGRNVGRLHAVGGGIQNTLLCRMTADAIGRPVMAGPVEATAMGNVITQMLGTGALPDLATARQVVAHSTPITVYEPGHAASWQPVLDAFRRRP